MIHNRLMAVVIMLTAILFLNAHNRVVITPSPKNIVYGEESYNITDKSRISYNDDSLYDMSLYLSDVLGVPVSKKKGDINIKIETQLPASDYKLHVSKRGISIKSGGREGVASAISTLRQLKQGRNIPAVSVNDSPRFKWRGFMLDVSRHFFDKDEIKSIIDSMAVYKFNKFHWHLTDDQGWRIKIDKYPLLTENGAWRLKNDNDSLCDSLYHQTGNKAMLMPQKNMRGNMYGGFYTKNDVKDIVAYAYARGIDIIPEIDMPGHCLSVVSNYKGVSCTDKIGWGKIFSSPMCPGKDKTIEICKDIFTEIFDLFPYEYVHIGGDEVDFTNWKNCADCKKRMEKHNLPNAEALQPWFNNLMCEFFKSHGKKMMAWDETIDHSDNRDITVMWWRNWSKQSLSKALKNGNDVIICPMFPMYLSNPSGKNTPEAIDRFDPLSDTYSKESKENVVGIQTCIWTERIPSYERLMQIMFPQFINVSRKAWE